MHRIICVDDEPSVLRALKRLFMDEKEYEVEFISEGQQALSVLADYEPDLVISDYRMPNLNGVEFLKQAKQLWPDALRIILSGYADAAVIVQLINDGEIYKFIPKPWDDHEILITIRRALEQVELVKENRRLTHKVMEQNELLQRMNEELERRVVERTRELTFKNQALQTAHNILDQVSIGILGISDDEIIVQANRMACVLLETEMRYLVGNSIHDVLSPAIRDKIVEQARLPRDVSSDEARRMAINELGENKIVCTPLCDGTTVFGTIVQILSMAPIGTRQMV